MLNRVLFFLLLLSISSLSAVPSEDVYWERVKEGIRAYHGDWTKPYYGAWDPKGITESQVKRLETLAKDVLQNEGRLEGEHYQVLAGQPAQYLAYQVILKELYALLYQEEFNEFEFLRDFKDGQYVSNIEEFFSQFPGLRDYQLEEIFKIDPEENPEEWEPLFEKFVAANTTDDNDAKVSKHLLSCSLTMEDYASFESALFYFIFNTNSGTSAGGKDIEGKIVNTLEFHGLSGEGIKEMIRQLVKAVPASDRGLLMQVFIPKKEVNSMLYISHPGGFLKTKGTTQEQIHAFLKERDCEKELKVGHNGFQARVIAGALKPDKVKIYRHTTIDPEEIEAYRNLVRKTLIEQLSLAR